MTPRGLERLSGPYRTSAQSLTPKESRCVTARLRQVPAHSQGEGQPDRQVRRPPRMPPGRGRTGQSSGLQRRTSPRERAWVAKDAPALGLRTAAQHPTLSLCPLPRSGSHHRRNRLARSGCFCPVAAVPGAREEAEGGSGACPERAGGASPLSSNRNPGSNQKLPAMAPRIRTGASRGAGGARLREDSPAS